LVLFGIYLKGGPVLSIYPFLAIGSFGNLLSSGPRHLHLSLFGQLVLLDIDPIGCPGVYICPLLGNWFFWEFTQLGAQGFTSVPFWGIGSFGYRPYWVPRSLHLSPFGELVLLDMDPIGCPGASICPLLGNWFFWLWTLYGAMGLHLPFYRGILI
jgi:hypothetical protein